MLFTGYARISLNLGKLEQYPCVPRTTRRHVFTYVLTYVRVARGIPSTARVYTLIFIAGPVIFIAGRPKVALLFWFFGDFRCGALLFMVIHVIYKYKNSLKKVVIAGPVIFTAGRPKAALLFWFFGDFRCGALLFMVIHVIYKYKNK